MELARFGGRWMTGFSVIVIQRVSHFPNIHSESATPGRVQCHTPFVEKVRSRGQSAKKSLLLAYMLVWMLGVLSVARALVCLWMGTGRLCRVPEESVLLSSRGVYRTRSIRKIFLAGGFHVNCVSGAFCVILGMNSGRAPLKRIHTPNGRGRCSFFTPLPSINNWHTPLPSISNQQDGAAASTPLCGGE